MLNFVCNNCGQETVHEEDDIELFYEEGWEDTDHGRFCSGLCAEEYEEALDLDSEDELEF